MIRLDLISMKAKLPLKILFSVFINIYLAWELQDLLNNVVQKSYNATDVFQLETCRALVALADADRSGRLNFEEFKGKIKSIYNFF